MPRKSQNPKGSTRIALTARLKKTEPKRGKNGAIPGSMAHGEGGDRSHRRRTSKDGTDAALRGGCREGALLLRDEEEEKLNGYGENFPVPLRFCPPFDIAVVPCWGR